MDSPGFSDLAYWDSKESIDGKLGLDCWLVGVAMLFLACCSLISCLYFSVCDDIMKYYVLNWCLMILKMILPVPYLMILDLMLDVWWQDWFLIRSDVYYPLSIYCTRVSPIDDSRRYSTIGYGAVWMHVRPTLHSSISTAPRLFAVLLDP